MATDPQTYLWEPLQYAELQSLVVIAVVQVFKRERRDVLIIFLPKTSLTREGQKAKSPPNFFFLKGGKLDLRVVIFFAGV